ncbi:MAG: M20/M25/M40 family metallo-hydrolase [Eubacteriales bacterium]|nr:M20/M25/M40 family metallo-hydrolase [Eubacteriales bacterium]
MDITAFLKEVTAIPGLPAYEDAAADCIAKHIAPYADEVKKAALGSVIAKIGNKGPKVLVCAHQDEIGMIVLKIEEDGCLRMHRMGGVDPRILPAHDVLVHTKNGPIPGVVGAKAPHLTKPSEREKALTFEDLYIDIGMNGEQAKAAVNVGDTVTLVSPLTELAGGFLTSKTMDNRASVAAMIACAEELSHRDTPATAYLCASSQEEVGAKGAITAAYGIEPDFGIAIDVTFGEAPGCDRFEAFPMDKPTIAIGPTLHPALTDRLRASAKKFGIGYSLEITGASTGTDASAMFLTRAGLPVCLISIPLRYMHTSVETLQKNTIWEAGRLMAAFIDDIARDWGDLEWY